MKNGSQEKLKNLVNATGFPFQIAISNFIKEDQIQHGWKVLSSENPWENPKSGRGGYIDLILRDFHGTQSLIVECKRVKDGEWVFLIPNRAQLSRRHGEIWVNGMNDYSGWADISLNPESPEAEFCIRDKDKNHKTMLERIAAELIEATESIAKE